MVHELGDRKGRREDCLFCNPPAGDVVLAGPLCYARWDKYPVSRGHMLIIPFRHVASFFDTTNAERHELLALAVTARVQIDASHHPDGYNFGVNIGAVAGQSVMHVHFHLIDVADDRQAQITVQDDGPGIPAEDLPHIFDRFYKTRDSGGMGLGLSIARKLVEAHGGSIAAESAPDRGMAMRINLPVD
jgi:diadenosine tetraphosphate (Ap4A) HIT family hydrolase